MREAYIIRGFRSPIGKANKGSLKNYRTDDLAVEIIKHLMKATPEMTETPIDDIIVGCANPEGEQGLQVGRLISSRALGYTVPGFTINRYCASGLEAIGLAVAKIRSGMADAIVAGGIESMSMIPMAGYKFAPSYKAIQENINIHVGMGNTAEAVAEKYNITRDQCDKFALKSHHLAANAIELEKFKDQIVPINISDVSFFNNQKVVTNYLFDTDEGVRKDTTIEALSNLKPVFKKGGVVTAGNSSQTSDGAAFVLIVSEEIVKKLSLTPIARLASCAVAGVDPLFMGIGPVASIPKALKQSGLKIEDIGLIELNEAFAAQTLAVIQEAHLDPKIVNINGGAIAMGHPLGCTGAKLTIQLIDQLKVTNNKYGMVTACVGGGQGISGIFEIL